MISRMKSPGHLLPAKNIALPNRADSVGGAAMINPSMLSEVWAVFDATENDTVLNSSMLPAETSEEVHYWLNFVSEGTTYVLSPSSALYAPYQYTDYLGGCVELNNDKLDAHTNWPGNLDVSALTIAGLFKYTPNALYTQYLYDGDAAVSCALAIQGSTGDVRMFGGSAEIKAVDGADPAATATYIFVARYNGANSKLWVSPFDTEEATSEVTGELNGATIAEFDVGCDGAGSNRLRESGICYLTVIEKALSDVEVNAVGRWIAEVIGGDISHWRF